MIKSVGSIAIVCRPQVAMIFVLAALLVSGAVLAQGDPRSNVNLIGMTPDPADIPDTYYRQQNEPACAVRPGDSACMICAYNDYRGVELFGDSWQGVSQSCDAGDTWRSRLAPGHPLHPAPLASEFAADPRLAAIPGMAIFNFIAGYRDSNVGVLAIQHWLEVNKEDADHYEPGLQTYIADTGTEGRFLDKPDMVAVLDAPNRQGTVTLSTEMENGDLGVITRDYPSGTLYVAYAVFTGSSSVKVLLKTSNDWGRTWQNQATKLSEGQNQVSGISLTAIDDKVVAVWRRKSDGNDVDSIMYSVISNGGKKATKGEVLANLCTFDQPTLTGTETNPPLVTFRTNDFPWAANDGNTFYAFYSDRGRNSDGSCSTSGLPRIVMHHSSNGLNWTNDGPIDPNPKTENGTDAPDSFQFMPTAFGADGRIQVAWYDTRREECAGNFPFVADYAGTCGSNSTLIQRTVDVYTTTVTAGTSPPPPVRASQFSIVVDRDTDTKYETEASFANKKLFAQGNAPFLGDYIAMAARAFRQDDSGKWISNASASSSNEDFFVAWTDNRDVRGVINSIAEPLPFSYPPATPTSSAAAIDNQQSADLVDDIVLAETRRVPEAGPPRDTTKTAEGVEGSDPGAMVCTPGQPATYERSRDSNIYGSLIKDRLRLYAPTPSKPLAGLQRAFVVALSNSDVIPHTYDLEIDPGSCDGSTCTASFRQHPSVPHNNPVYGEQVTVPAKSTLARTVFVSGTVQGTVKVEALENGQLIAAIQLGNSASMSDPENCASSTCAVAANELHNLELQTLNANLLNANLLNANLLNSPLVDWALDNGYCDAPATVGCVLENAGQQLDPNGTDVVSGETNAALLNAALLNANLLNANLLNANLLNAALLNANLLNMPLSDPSAPTLDPALIQAALAGGASATVGGVIMFAADPANNINAALLNAALLNANLLNANLLNANLLNANLLNAALLNANLLNANLLNANLLNPGVEAAALLNANLLNADLLNANLLNPTLVALATEGGCCDHEPEPTIGSVVIYSVNHPERINAALLNAALLNANLLNANLLNANLLNANLLNANLLNANLLNTDLANANLLNANLLNANLLNADLLNANLLNANLLNTSLWNAAITAGETVTYDDYTYPITNNGNVTTAIDADITINAPRVDVNGEQVLDVIGSKLITWTANATPTVIDCVERVQLDTRVQSITGTDSSLEVATIEEPFNGEVSAIVGPGETLFVTLRVVGTPDQLRKVRVGGFTASSQAANCVTGPNGPVCDTKLNEGIEQILFADLEPPVITVPGDFAVEATDANGAIVNYSVSVFDANDASPSLECLPESGSVFDLGSTPVSCNASDASGNFADTATFTVTVQDTTPPVLSLPANITMEATSAAGAIVTFAATATDSAGSATASCSPASGLVFALGINSVTCTADDGRGNTASGSFNVTVQDTTSPVLLGMPGNISLEATSAAGAVATWIEPTATDNAGSASVSCSKASGSTFALGTAVVTCNADDGRGNTAAASFDVTVLDTTAPVLSLPANLTMEATSAAGATITFAATATDIAGSASVSCSPASGSTFALGATTVTCTADDGRGNTASGSFNVTVQDTTSPVLLGVPGNISLEATGAAGAVAIWIDPTATDNSGFASVNCSPASGSTFALGTTNVTCNADDGFSNSTSAGFTVTVTDTTAPVIDDVTPPIGFDPPTLPFTLAATASKIEITWPVTGADADPDLSVSCTIDDVPPVVQDGVITRDGNLFTATFVYEFPAGDTSVSCTATDGADNTTALSQTFIVTVVDATAPVITVPTAPVNVSLPNAAGTFEYNYGALISVTDNSDVAPTLQCRTNVTNSYSSNFVGIFPYGDTTVSCIAGDRWGNESSASFVVRARYQYNIKLFPPKGSAKAGSAVPLDWQYLSWVTGLPVPSATVPVSARYAATNDCSTPTPGGMNSEDSGSSNFRYSASNLTWQFNWQTPSVKGKYLIIISPPGNGPNATACLTLR